MPTAYPSSAAAQPTSPSSSNGKLAYHHLKNGHTQHMDGRQSDYPSSGSSLPRPFAASPGRLHHFNTAHRATSCCPIPTGPGPAKRELFVRSPPRLWSCALVRKIGFIPRLYPSASTIYSRTGSRPRRNGASNKSVHAFAAQSGQQPKLSQHQV
jgi:hypothetical protein